MRRVKQAIEERFWLLVDRSQYSPGGCWLWHGGKDRRFNGDRKSYRIHVFVFLLFGGSLGKKKISHQFGWRCENHFCVQPAHIYLPTNSERFWSFVDKSAGPDGCWQWTGILEGRGRGRFYSKEFGNLLSHQYAFIDSGGVLTKKNPWVLHKCHKFGLPDNRACCNPAHLKAGTPKENTRDSVISGTQRNTRKTNCSRGHPLTSSNLVKNHLKLGIRDCRLCYNFKAMVLRRIRKGWTVVEAENTPSYKERSNA